MANSIVNSKQKQIRMQEDMCCKIPFSSLSDKTFIFYQCSFKNDFFSLLRTLLLKKYLETWADKFIGHFRKEPEDKIWYTGFIIHLIETIWSKVTDNDYNEVQVLVKC